MAVCMILKVSLFYTFLTASWLLRRTGRNFRPSQLLKRILFSYLWVLRPVSNSSLSQTQDTSQWANRDGSKPTRPLKFGVNENPHLVGGFNTPEKYESQIGSSYQLLPTIGEKNSCSKPPTWHLLAIWVWTCELDSQETPGPSAESQAFLRSCCDVTAIYAKEKKHNPIESLCLLVQSQKTYITIQYHTIIQYIFAA
jgi:hypothetical protein